MSCTSLSFLSAFVPPLPPFYGDKARAKDTFVQQEAQGGGSVYEPPEPRPGLLVPAEKVCFIICVNIQAMKSPAFVFIPLYKWNKLPRALLLTAHSLEALPGRSICRFAYIHFNELQWAD